MNNKRKRFHQQSIIDVLIIFAMIFAIMHIGVTVYSRILPQGRFTNLVPMFDLDNEFNVPAAYTGMLLGAAALLSFMIALREKIKHHKFVWFGLAIVLLYLGFDEIVSLHERVAAPIRQLLDIGNQSILYHAWVVPVLIVAIIGGMGLYCIRNNMKLLGTEQKKILITLLILVIGDVILESLGTKFYSFPLIYKLGSVLVEEMFEIGMISLVLYKLVSHYDSN